MELNGEIFRLFCPLVAKGSAAAPVKCGRWQLFYYLIDIPPFFFKVPRWHTSYFTSLFSFSWGWAGPGQAKKEGLAQMEISAAESKDELDLLILLRIRIEHEIVIFTGSP